MNMSSLIEIKNLYVNYNTEQGKAKVLDGVELKLQKGVISGIIGESGCGKSTLAKTILSILPSAGKVEKGEVIFKGEDLLKMSRNELNKRINGKEITFIPQDPSDSLNPLFTIGVQMKDLVIPKLFNGKRKNMSKIKEMFIKQLEEVQLSSPEDILKRFPHELSGGQKQRLFIAISLIIKPSLIIADEPTTALDVTIEAQILELLKRTIKNNMSSTLYITHNLAVASKICDMITVMYCGQIVESAPKKSFFTNPAHPYSRKLLACLPEIGKKIEDIPGKVPSLLNPPEGCRFQTRCERKTSQCTSSQKPPKKEISANHWVQCYNPFLNNYSQEKNRS